MFSIKFILINFIKWIKTEKRLFVIFMTNLSIVSAVIIFLFSFNNQLLISIDNNIRKDTYGRVYSLHGDINDNIYNFLDNLISNNKLPKIQFVYLSGMADVDNKQAKIATINFINSKFKGYYYEDKYDITEPNKVALATDIEINLAYGTKYDQKVKNIIINGKKYDVVYTRYQFIDGMEAMIGGVLIRMSYQDFVAEVDSIKEIKIVYDQRLDKNQEMALKNEIKELDSDIEFHIQPKETSNEKNYKNEMIIDIILLFATLLCLIKIYEYILDTRRNEIVMYRICGARISFIIRILFLEIFLMATMGFLIGTIIFIVIWQFGLFNEQIFFNINTWIKALIVLFGCMLTVTFNMAIKLSKVSLINIRKGIINEKN